MPREPLAGHRRPSAVLDPLWMRGCLRSDDAVTTSLQRLRTSVADAYAADSTTYLGAVVV